MTETLDLSSFAGKKKLKAKIEPGDLYIKGPCVYRVGLYNESDDKVILETTNDNLPELSSWTKRVDLRQLGFVECPLALLGPASDVFELRDKPTPESIESLKRYRKDNEWVYEKYHIDEIFASDFLIRDFKVPEALASVSRLTIGQNIEIAYLFNSLTKEQAKRHYLAMGLDSVSYKYAMRFQSWPIIWVPKRFGEGY